MVEIHILEAGIAILAILIPVISGLIGTKWQLAKQYGQKAQAVAHQANVALDKIAIKAKTLEKSLSVINDAIADDKITPAEQKAISKAIGAVVEEIIAELKTEGEKQYEV